MERKLKVTWALNKLSTSVPICQESTNHRGSAFPSDMLQTIETLTIAEMEHYTTSSLQNSCTSLHCKTMLHFGESQCQEGWESYVHNWLVEKCIIAEQGWVGGADSGRWWRSDLCHIQQVMSNLKILHAVTLEIYRLITTADGLGLTSASNPKLLLVFFGGVMWTVEYVYDKDISKIISPSATCSFASVGHCTTAYKRDRDSTEPRSSTASPAGACCWQKCITRAQTSASVFFRERCAVGEREDAKQPCLLACMQTKSPSQTDDVRPSTHPSVRRLFPPAAESIKNKPELSWKEGSLRHKERAIPVSS